MADVIRHAFTGRWGTAADLASLNDVPRRGERCYESDTGYIKYGDGITAYNDLPYFTVAGVGSVAWGAITGTLSAQSDLQAALTSLSSADSAEATARAAADSALSSAITSEATTRAADDATLSAAITAEAAARSSADALKVAKAGDTMTGNLKIDRSGTAGGLELSSTAGVVSDIRWQSAGVERWILRKNGDTETGLDAGSNMELLARSDAGATLHVVATFYRQTGLVNWKYPPTFANVPLETYNCAAAGGTADALTATLTNVPGFFNRSHFYIEAAAANATTTPTLALNGGSALTIKKKGGSALAAGDIAGAGHILQLVYSTTGGNHYELLNPATDATGGGGSSSIAAVTSSVSQTAHGFAVGTPVKLTSAGWVVADADAETTMCDAMVNAVADANNFTVTEIGQVTATLVEWDVVTGETGAVDHWSTTDKASEITLSNGDTTATRSSTNNNAWRAVRGPVSHTTGKYYAECSLDANGATAGSMSFGVATAAASLSQQVGGNATSWGFQANNPSPGPTPWYNGVQGSVAGTVLSVGQRCGVAVDFDAGKIWFRLNGSWVGGGDPGAGTSPSYTFTPGTALYLALSQYSASQQNTLYSNTGENTGSLPTGYAMWDSTAAGVGLTKGEYYWLSTTAGRITKTQPTSGFAQCLGVAESATVLRFAKGPVVALAGGTTSGYVRGSKITESAAQVSTAVTIPLDNTIPQSTEGAEFTQLATSYTPSSADSILEIEVFIAQYTLSSSANAIGALFQDSDASAIAAVNATPSTSNYSNVIIIRKRVVAGSTSARTYKFRYGPNGGTMYLNQRGDGLNLGGVTYSHMKVTEYAP